MSSVISIILPAYNAQNTLERAIRSILSQDFKNWQLIIVNDGSKDKTKEIAEKFAAEDARVHVITQKNGGRSAARNTGLQYAMGDYIVFLDADDELCFNALQNLFNATLAKTCDLVIGGSIYKKYKITLKKMYIQKEQVAKYLFSLRNNQIIFNSVSNKLFRADIIRKYNISFPLKLDMGEDIVFVLSYCNQIQNMSVIPALVCNYLPNKQSITRNDYSHTYIDRSHTAKKLWLAMYRKWNLPLTEIYGSFFNYRMFGCSQLAVFLNIHLLREVVLETFKDQQIADFAQKVKDTRYDNLFSKMIRRKQMKLWTILAWLFGCIKRIKKYIDNLVEKI